ncbi:MAG: histidine phosphatase family protein, partial [Ilumatobacteraceae bacterium]|nr:histidine phosphatase family protein [Ilumatobacteraceae bacterium]
MTATGSIIIVRHGRTAFNATGRLQGRADNPLDEVGVLQAERVAHHVA